MTHQKIRFTVLSTVVLAALAGCGSMAPEYERPALPVAQSWPSSMSKTLNTEQASAAQLRWQQVFIDTQLQQLIELALENNRDFQVAVLNIEKARAQYRIQRSAFMPDIGINAQSNSGRAPVAGTGVTSRQYDAGIGVSAWEIDLFGRIANLSEQQRQHYLATQAMAQAAHSALIAEVAITYVNLTAKEALLEIAKATEQNWSEAYQLQHYVQSVGNSSKFELFQIESELEKIKGERITLESDIAVARNILALLIGSELPQSLQRAPLLHQSLVAQELPVGLPSEVLQNRPDVMAAEHRLLSQNANIGAARAAFFPSISLTGSIGLASDSLSGLVNGGTHAWSFLPQLHIPIFAGGRLQANLEAAEVEKDIAIAEYEHAIQVAFREVADGLAIHAYLQEQLVAQESRSVAATAANSIIEQRYASGVSGYLEVLEARRALYAAQTMLVSTQSASQANVIELYKALGGGATLESESMVSGVQTSG